MPLIRRGAIVAGALAALIQAGCAGRTTPPIITDVRLSLEVAPSTGSPSLPVVADVRVKNVGNTAVLHCEGCGCGNGVELSVLGPDGAPVWLRDPNALLPLCPDGFVTLDPGQEVGGRIVFTGTLYRSGQPVFPSPTYSAPPGRYTVIARFGYTTRAPEEWTPLERRATFDWVP